MKVKVYLFRLLIALTTFILGTGVYLSIQYFQSETIEDEFQCTAQNNVPLKEVKTDNFITITSPAEKTPIIEEQNQEEFIPDGYYYLTGKIPKVFKDFGYLEIRANQYVSEKNGSSYWKPITPEVWIVNKNAFKSTQININNRHIYFKTDEVKGISYKFTGDFPVITDEELKKDEPVYLKGTLTKMKNKKEIAKMTAKLSYTEGC